MNLKNQLKFYLNEKGLTAAALARLSGVPKQSISDWLGGANPRNINHVKEIAGIFKTSVDNLMFGNGHDLDSQKSTDLAALMGDGWIGGLFEVKLRRVHSLMVAAYLYC